MPIQNVQRGPNVAGDSLSASMTVTGSATLNTKGSYTQIFAATAVDSCGLIFMPDDISVSATNSSTLVDIAIGGAGSEVVIINNVNIGGWGHGSLFPAPIFIPAGSRVSLRLQSAIASKVLNGRFSLISAPILGDAAQWCETFGASTATSAGTTLTTPSVSGTKTAYQTIAAATTRNIKWITWCLASLGTNIAAAKGGFDIAYGAAAAEVPVMQNARWEQQGTEIIRPCCYVVPCNIPAGSRLAVRWDSTSTAAASVANAVVYGFS